MTSDLAPTTKVPAEWPSLMEQAEAAVPEFAVLKAQLIGAPLPDLWRLHRRLDSQAPHLAQLGRTINTLDMTAVEANRYHALRYSIAGLGRVLEDRATREQIIEAGSELLIIRSAKGIKSNLERGLGNNVAHTVFEQAVAKAYQSVPEPVWLAGELLTMESLDRQATLEMSRQSFGRPWRARYRQLNHLRRINTNGDSPLMRKDLERASTGGASALCRAALGRDWRFHGDGIPSKKALAGLRHGSFPGVARRTAASKRTVDITHHHAETFGDENGHLTFSYSSRPQSVRNGTQFDDKQEELTRYFERDTNLGCPAVREGESVETALDMVVSMVELATTKLQEAA